MAKDVRLTWLEGDKGGAADNAAVTRKRENGCANNRLGMPFVGSSQP